MPSSSSPAGGALAPPLPLPSSVAVVGEASIDARSSELEANNKKTTTIHKGYFLSSEKDFKFVQVEHEFHAAHGVISLQSSELIQFPIIHEDHWFLFIVNIKDRKFVFIDSLHTEGHSYHKSIKARIIRNFISSFSQCAKRSTINFAKFDIEYQRPHEQTSNKDSGVYVMMYMKNYGPRIALETVFNVEDIPNIRIIILNQLLRSKHNLEDLSLLHSIIAKGPKVC